MRLRTGLLLVALLGGLLAPGSAGAGPIHWSYSSVGGEKNGVTLIGRPLTHEESPPGVPDGFSLGPYERFEHGELPWPTTVEIPLQLTITDAESQESRQIEVPYIFHTVQPDPIDLRAFIPGVPEWQFVLGENRYTVYDPAPPHDEVSGGDLAVVAEPLATATTPEPTTLVLASLGLGGVALARWRQHRRRSATAASVGGGG
ncbi:MAG TPA: PEP-CTERM sorting domain-containing protein [Gemmataceae bacterium]